jgi:hypothetical protein
MILGKILHNPWLQFTAERFDLKSALCASLGFHVSLLLVLATISTDHPAVGVFPRFEVIWVAPASVPADLRATAGVSQPSDRSYLQRENAADFRPRPAAVIEPASAPPAIRAAREPSGSGQSAGGEELAAELEQLAEEPAAAGPALNRGPPAPAVQEKGEQVKTATPARLPPVREEPIRAAQKERQDREQVRRVDHLAKPAPERAAAGNSSVGKAAASGDRPARTDQKLSAPQAEQQGLLPAGKAREAESLAGVPSDLRLVSSGNDSIRLSVSFRAFPKARRGRTPSRSEALQAQKAAPAQLKTRGNAREAIIATAREGIYTFSAETGSQRVPATFILRVFESGSRERIAPLGTRVISGPTVLVKILMPEAIIWDDESAFTGALEDSESETRFNATTGLYWKEYRE